jgi:ankyrin repeat protein
VTTDNGKTPLLLEFGHEGVVKVLLIKEGVDVNSKDNYGETPLSLAERYGHKAVVRLLLA